MPQNTQKIHYQGKPIERTEHPHIVKVQGVASGEPIISPTLDMVLGCYYITHILAGAKGEGRIFASEDEAILAEELGQIDVRAKIKVLRNGEILETSAGRIRLNFIIPNSRMFGWHFWQTPWRTPKLARNNWL